MKMRKVYLAALLAVLAACTKAPQAGDGYVSDPEAVRIDASVGLVTRSNPLGTAEEQAKFNKGDKISVIHTTVNKQVDYVFDGISWAPEGEDYLTWQTDATNTFRIQYPYIGHESDFGEFFKDQSTVEKMTRSDLMQSEDIECTKIPDDRILSATLERQRSLITVVIAGFGDEFSSEEAKVTDLKLHLWDGGQGDEIITVTPYIRDVQGVAQPAGTAGLVGYSYTAIGRNDCKYSGKAFITMTVAGKSLTVANPADMEVGKHYTYNLTVGKETVKIAGVTVAPWGTGDPIDGTYETVTDRYSVWDGMSVESLNGDGTAEYPYVISTAAQLACLAELVNGGKDFSGEYIKLNANIDLNNQDWTPIGTSGGVRFKGHFDGNGYVIINMKVVDYTDDAGLFGLVRDAEISNVILRNGKVFVAGNQLAALLVGHAERVSISHCKVDGSVSSSYKAAGILAEPKGSVNISDCEADVDCYGKDCVGGIVADGGDASVPVNIVIKSCVVKGQVSSTNHSVGGIAAHLQGSVEISDCVSYADLKCSRVYFSSIGGIVGDLYCGKVENCTVYSRISCGPIGGNSSVVGGVFGTVTDVTISGLKFEGYMDIDKDCNNTTDIEYTGYFIGKIDNSITVTDKCTYREAGTKDLKAVASYPEGVDITKIEEAN